MLALSDITVISLEQAIAAPFCTRQLADLGARVIKIERPDGGDFARHYDTRTQGLSSHFVWTNRSKQSLSLNIKHPKGQDILLNLLKTADVFVQNLAPGTTRRLGLSFEQLHQLNPQLIVCDISGYGDDSERAGPYHSKKAYDLLIQAESGFLSISGAKDHVAKAGCSIADIAAGMYAYSNILSALIERGKTGKGKRIDVSMLESMTEWMGYPLYYSISNQHPPERTGAEHASIYPYGPFPTGDGQHIILAVQNAREWASFCQQVLENEDLIHHPHYCDNIRRVTHRAQLYALICQAFSTLSFTQIQQRLEQAHIANAQINNMHEVWQHPQLTARQRWTAIDGPLCPIPTLKPVGLTQDEDFVMRSVPTLGQHNHEILQQLGFSDTEIQTFSQQHIL